MMMTMPKSIEGSLLVMQIWCNQAIIAVTPLPQRAKALGFASDR